MTHESSFRTLKKTLQGLLSDFNIYLILGLRLETRARLKGLNITQANIREHESALGLHSNQRSASGTRVPGIPRPGPGFSGPGLGPGQTFSCGRETGTEGPVPCGTRDGTRD